VPATSGEPSAGDLKRVIGRRMLVLFIVGDILGAGIYALTGKVAGEVGGAIWVPFLAAFALAFLTAAAYAELVGKHPQAAGAALYAHKAYGRPFFTFMVAFTVMASGITSAAAAARSFGGRYLQEFVTLPTVAVAVAFVVILAAINLRGVSESVKVNLVLTVIELTGLLVIIVIGAYALATGEGNPGRALEFSQDANLALAVLGGTALAFYALLGFEDSVNMAEETHDPTRVFPRALFTGLAVAGVVYLLVAFTATMLVQTSTLQESSGPLLEVVEAANLSFPPQLFALIALVAVTNTALINMVMASRLVYGMARQRIVPRGLGAVASSRRTPYVAIAFTSVLAIVLVATGDLADLADTTVLLLLCVFLVVNVSVLVLRRDEVDGERRDHFRAPTAVPVVGALACVVLISPLTGRDADVYLRALVLLAVGVALWFVNRLVLARTGDAERAQFDAAALSD
jgi:amino acid transporter